MISSQLAILQATRRAGLLKQVTSLRFLLRQGLAIRGHLAFDTKDGRQPCRSSVAE